MREPRWLIQAERYLVSARSELELDPHNLQLAALVELIAKVVDAEQARVQAAQGT